MSKPKKSKRFIYNLKTVLKVREIKERQEKDKFHEAEKKVQEEKDKLLELQTIESAMYQTLLELMSSGEIPNMNLITLRKHHLELMKEKIADQEDVLQEAERKKEAHRQALIQALKEKKIMEKDKQKKRLDWKKLMDKEDAKFLDDIATIGYENRRRKAQDEEPKHPSM